MAVPAADTPIAASPATQAPGASPSNTGRPSRGRNIDFSIPTGRGGGAIDPLTALLGLGIAGLAAGSARSRARRGRAARTAGRTTSAVHNHEAGGSISAIEQTSTPVRGAE
jgi:hypothetical protein